MRTVVVYDSEFKNTEAIARIIADTVGGELVHGRDTAHLSLSDVGLLFVGAPTQGGRPTGAILGFLDGLSGKPLRGIDFAAFDTRIDAATRGLGLRALMGVIGYAAPKIARVLTARGGHEVVTPEGFIVLGKEGPLREGEMQRASSWAEAVVRATGRVAA